jgi:hypothetical protein
MASELEKEIGEHYFVEDEVLPILKLDALCEIRIEVNAEHVSLSVGARDWQWKRGCPDIESCGTLFDPPSTGESQ